MTRTLEIVTSALLFGAAFVGATVGQADDRSAPVQAPGVQAPGVQALGVQAAGALAAGALAAGALATGAEVRVPLPVSRPAWIERVGAGMSRDDKPSPQLLAETSGAAPSAGDSGLKSGSAEALAVQLEGAKVLSAEGNVVGEVRQVVEQQGAGRQAVVSVGGFLGIGESRVLVPTETLAPSGKGVVRTALTEQQLKNLPPYEN